MLRAKIILNFRTNIKRLCFHINAKSKKNYFKFSNKHQKIVLSSDSSDFILAQNFIISYPTNQRSTRKRLKF